MKKNREDVEVLKNKIISAALKLFAAKGYTNTNIQDIAEEINISRGPIYYHFKDKSTLYKTAVSTSFESFIEDLELIFNSDSAFEEKIKLAVQLGYSKHVYFFFLRAHEAFEIFSDIKLLHDTLKNRIFQLILSSTKEALDSNRLKCSYPPEIIVDYIFGIFYAVSGISYNLERNERQIDKLISIFMADFKNKFI